LYAFFYSIHENSLEEKPKSQIEVLETLKKLGFRTNHKSKHCLDLKSVEDFCLEFQEKREQLPYEIDGVVIKINEFEIQDLLGFTAKFPRFALAYKFPAMQAVSRIEDILISVGRTGALTPVAKLTATLLAGSTISRATLHNEDEIRRKDIKIGDHVVIQKAGDIIPEVVSVLINLRDGTQRDFHFPETCPVCGAKVAKEEKEAAYRCTNPSCQAMEIQNLMHFVGKAALDIDGMGPKVIEQLVQAGLIVDAADIFTLADDDLRQLPLFKEKRSTNLIEAIKKAKTPQLGKFIFALGIRFIGEKIADDLAEFLYSTYLHDLEEVAPFELLEKIKNLSFIELSNVEGFGEKVCQSFLHWLSEPKTANLMQKFQNSGVKIQLQKNKNFDSKLKGKNFVFTGTLNLNRNQAKEMAKNLGAKVQSAISANTDFLVCGENAGSKLQKAKALGVKVLNEQDFLELVS
jgi:DNA ligase (NAD+)